MLVLTSILLLMVAFVFGFSRRPWWQVGPLALVACGPLQFAQFWTGNWRYGVGLPYEPALDSRQVVWIVGCLLFWAYVGYALGVVFARAATLRSQDVAPVAGDRALVRSGARHEPIEGVKGPSPG
jgi:hypothetical protein